MIGRKNKFSEEIQNLNYHAVTKQRTTTTFSGIVLDICGAHKPKSRFLEEEFSTGIWLILAVPKLEEIIAVCWSDTYEDLRSYGSDENITGRACSVTAISSRVEDLRFGKVSFNETRRNSYTDPKEDNFFSLGVLFGVTGNYEAQMMAHKTPSSSISGESWRPIK
jgi:hypothetical protein